VAPPGGVFDVEDDAVADGGTVISDGGDCDSPRSNIASGETVDPPYAPRTCWKNDLAFNSCSAE
jgi:hypothetical protein